LAAAFRFVRHVNKTNRSEAMAEIGNSATAGTIGMLPVTGAFTHLDLQLLSNNEIRVGSHGRPPPPQRSASSTNRYRLLLSHVSSQAQDCPVCR
jgi:hypothetical protein